MPQKFKGALRCSVKETSPNFLVTDGSYFISAYFTEESYKQFRKENSALRVTDLQDIMVQINDWSVELVASSCFTSYAGVEMKMIIKQMDIKKDYRVELKKFPTNLYRDDKMKTCVQNFLNQQQRRMISDKDSKAPQSQKNKAIASNMMEAIVSSTNSSAKKGSTLDSRSSLSDKVGNPEVFKKYEFMKRSTTKVYPVAEIIKTEKGKKGLEEMEKRQHERDSHNFEKKKAQGGNSKGDSQEASKVTVKKTLVLDSKTKESKITATIQKSALKKKTAAKKEGSRKITQDVIKKLKKSISENSKKLASKKISKESPAVKSGNLGKKRIATAQEKDDKMVVTRKDFERYIEMVRQEERSKLQK